MKKFLIIISILCIGASSLFAQSVQVSGTVTSDDDGQSMPGVSVIVKGTTLGTVTDVNGKYSISVSQGATLVFSFVGMATQEIAIENRQIVDVVMTTSAREIDEVVVVAYGTAKKSSFTGSVETVSAKKLENRSVSNVTKALDGTVAGLKTTSGGGQPGDGPSVVIRGYGSINASKSPLYVVDGIPYDGAMNAINTADIESISVLKDASAATLYGSRAANGVIIVTTKKGKSGVPDVNFKASWGISSRAVPRYETVNEKEYMEIAFQLFKNDAIYADGINPDIAGGVALSRMASSTSGIGGELYNPFNFKIPELINPTTGKVRDDATLKYHEDWVDELLADKPLRQEYQFSFSGGAGKTNFMTSLGYLNEEGLLVTTGFKRFSGRINIDSQLKDWLKAGLNAAFSQTTSNFQDYNNSSSTGNVWYSSQFIAPIYPVYMHDVDGKLILDAEGNKQYDYGKTRPIQSNWNAIATLYDDKTTQKRDNMSGRTYLQFGGKEMNVDILKDFSFITNFGFDYYNGDYLQYYNPYNGNATSSNGRAEKINTKVLSYTWNQILSYNAKFAGRHNLDVLAGHEYYNKKINNLNAQKTGFAFGGLYELDAASTISSAGSYEDNYTVESYFSRANYNYDDKYYLSGSFRTDGSSRFYKDNRWGQFWSVGASWRVSSEGFMDNLDFINNLTVKASYGTQGNDMILKSVNGVYVQDYFPWMGSYSLEYPDASSGGVIPVRLENRELSWEKSNNFNVGIESKMFDSRLGLTIEYYNKYTTDILLDRPKALSTGFGSYTANIGDMVNSGIEATITGDIIRNDDLNWNATLIFATVKNEVKKLTDDSDQIVSSTSIIKEGNPLYAFYLPKSAGVDPLTGSPLYWIYKDADGNDLDKPYISDDYAKTTANRQICGTRIPDLEGSIASEIRYMGFDLSVLATFSIGGKILDYNYADMIGTTGVLYNGNTFHKDALRAWKQPGDVTDVPKLWWSTTTSYTDRNLINASYFAIKNIALGFTLPKRISDYVGINSVRIFVQGDNIALFSHLKGLDPQFNFSGVTSNYSYITNRLISFGIDVKF